MKTGRTLQDLAVELDRQAALKRDFVVNTSSMDFSESGDKLSLKKLKLMRGGSPSILHWTAPSFMVTYEVVTLTKPQRAEKWL